MFKLPFLLFLSIDYFRKIIHNHLGRATVLEATNLMAHEPRSEKPSAELTSHQKADQVDIYVDSVASIPNLLSTSLKPLKSTAEDILLKDDRTLPLRISRSELSSSNNVPYFQAIEMDISASSIDRQIESFFLETPLQSPEVERSHTRPFELDANSHDLEQFLYRKSSYADRDNNGRNPYEAEPSVNSGFPKLRMTRSPSCTKSNQPRARMESAASTHAGREDEAASPRYLFLHKLPSHSRPPLKKTPSSLHFEHPEWDNNSDSPLHSAEQKGKGRSQSQSFQAKHHASHGPNPPKDTQKHKMENENYVTNSHDNKVTEASRILKSPQHVWYFVRRLVGLELRWEANQAWKLTNLESSSSGNPSNAENSPNGNNFYSPHNQSIDSPEKSLDQMSATTSHLPLLGFLLRDFVLTLPILRDIGAGVPNIYDGIQTNQEEILGGVTSSSAYWTSGIIPVLRRLHQSNLSNQIDLGSPGFLDILFGSYVTSVLERMITTHLNICDYNLSNMSSNVPLQLASNVATSQTNSPMLIPHHEIPRFRFSSLSTSEPSPHSSNQSPNGTSRRVNQLLEDEGTIFFHGFEKEPRRYSGISLQPSQRASIGVVTPSNSNCAFEPHSTTTSPDDRFEYNLLNQVPANVYEQNYDDPSSNGLIEPISFSRKHKGISPKLPLPSVSSSSGGIEPSNLAYINRVDVNNFVPHKISNENVEHLPQVFSPDSNEPTPFFSTPNESVTSLRERIKLLKLEGRVDSPRIYFKDKTNQKSPLTRKFSWKRPMVHKKTSQAVKGGDIRRKNPEHSDSERIDIQASDGSVSFTLITNSNSTPGTLPQSGGSHQRSNKFLDKKNSIRGYEIDESEAVNQPTLTARLRNLSGGSGLSSIRAPLRSKPIETASVESLGHYQKTTDTQKFYGSRPQPQIPQINSHHKGEALDIDKSRTMLQARKAPIAKRRFTVRSISQWKNSRQTSVSEHKEQMISINNSPIISSEQVNKSYFSYSSNAISSNSTRDSLSNSENKSCNKGHSSFCAEMRLPDSLIKGLSCPYETISSPEAIAFHSKYVLIPKSSLSWPWGEPVPFWKGTPVHEVSWGGFEVDIVGLRKGITVNKFIIRVRRPSRLDEYVVRKENEFKRYYSALSKHFPGAHLIRIPDHEVSVEDEMMSPDGLFLPVEASGMEENDRHTFTNRISCNEISEANFDPFFGPLAQSLAEHKEISAQAPMKPGQVGMSNHTGIPRFENQFPPGLGGPAKFRNRKDSVKSVGRREAPKRRNTLASLFGGGLHRSRFSLDTRSDRNEETKHDEVLETNNTFSWFVDRETVDDPRTISRDGISRRASMRALKRSPDAQRRALRAWLRDALSIRHIGHHRETAAFLLLGSMVPHEEDLLDIREREKIDEIRRKKRIQIAQRAAERAKSVYEYWCQMKDDIVNGKGIENFSDALRNCATVEDLPINFQKAFEWIRMEIAQRLHELLVIGNQSEVIFGKLLAFHAIFPWFLFKNVLKIRKPNLMCKALFELFLSKKLNIGKVKHNLARRLIEIAINETEGDPAEVERRIQACRGRIQSLTMCEKIIKYAYASREVKRMFRQYSDLENLELVVTIVRSAEEPRLDKYDLERIMRASHTYQTLLKKNRNRITNPMLENINVRLILDLKLYLRLVSQKRDSEQIRHIFSEASSVEAIEIVINPFLEFLKRTYQIGDAAKTIEDAQNFFEQLIKIVNALRSRIQDPQKSVRVLCRLLAKHQNNLYTWLHLIHRKDSIIEEFLQWLSTARDFFKRALVKPLLISEIISEVDIKKLETELDELIAWENEKRKRQYEQLCRRYSADVDGDDPVIVEGDGFGKSKIEPLIEPRPNPPSLDQITQCLRAFRVAISRILSHAAS
ncbi:hypothetical protein O181_020777 [Austropuccinia psidii MF-1]|uniref:PX domain-containing protein n=1 Tax=Austropuccinia psidii MF-1 TaxID=1389203 RepID=A0A9Q3GVM4_9BASI|nr:hypothetical protein [Austropuccinia psidii MF-1]